MTAPLLGPAWRRLVLACAFPLLAAVVVGCDQAQQLGERVAPLGETPAPPEVPFGARLDEAGLLYTYVRADGSFAITEHASEIPEESRKQVRLVKEGHPPGTPSHVFVADLTGKAPGDELSPLAIGRAAWEAHGLKYRHAKVAPLENQASAPGTDDVAATDTRAVIYGAEWCGPCHQAEDYLRKKGIQVVKKDIEEDPSAAQEMRGKLRKAGIGSSSIPILDIAGTILVGFNPRAVDAALRRAGK